MGFYQRRTQGVGKFITRREFERWNPQAVTDIVRHAQVFDVTPNPARHAPSGRRADLRDYLIVSRRAMRAPWGPTATGECPPLIYLDDTRLGNALQVNVDDILAVNFIEAMELYDGGVQVPIEYQSNGSSCGVIVVWSRVPGGEPPSVARHLEIGGQLGGQVASGGFQDRRLGANLSIGMAGVFEFYPAFNVLLSGVSGNNRSGWQGLVSLRARPFGVDSPWYVAAGISTLDTQESLRRPSFREGFSEAHAVVLTGVRIPMRWARPFVELQILSPTNPDNSSVHLFTGAAVRVF